MKQPYAYLRKSRVTTDRHVSWEVQEAAVREMAGADVVILSDWNKSGRRSSTRPGYQELLREIEDGQASGLYSYSLSRLSRSIADFARLVELCQAHNVPIHLYSEKHLDFYSASGRLMVSILAAFAQMESELASERARDTLAIRRARGDHIGGRAFSSPAAVLAAYRESGSFYGAASLLTAQGVPTRNGLRVWQANSVRSVIWRVAPEELPINPSRGAKKHAPFLFYRLLRCHCGRTLTCGRSGGYTYYLCAQGRFDPTHGATRVVEHVVLAWAREEAALLSPPVQHVMMAESTEEKQNALRNRRVRLGRAFVDGMIGEAEYQSEKAEIERELAVLDAEGRAVRLEPIRWDRDPVIVNQTLRALWEYIQMNKQQRPEFAMWTLPAWRSGEPQAPG